MKLRVLQVIDTLGVGGAEKIFVTICNLLVNSEVSVTGLFLTEAGVLKNQLNKKINLHELKRKNKWSLKKMNECSKILKQYDIIHCHFRHVFVYIRMVSLIFNVKTPILFHSHSSKKLKKSSIFILKYIFKPRFLICVDQESLNFYKKQLQFNNKNSFLLENIIISHSKSQVQSSAKEFDFVLVGNIKRNKNNIFAIDLAEKLNKSLLIIGNNQDNEYFQTLSNRIHSSTTKVLLKQGVTDVSDYISLSKFGLMVSNKESGPLVLLEYMSFNLPFLAHETGEISKMMKPFFPNFFISNFDINSWKERLDFLEVNKHDSRKMEQVFQQFFGEDDYRDKLLNIYRCVQKN